MDSPTTTTATPDSTTNNIDPQELDTEIKAPECTSADVHRYLFESTDTLRPCVEKIIDQYMGDDFQQYVCCGAGKILLYFGSQVDEFKKTQIMQSLEQSIIECLRINKDPLPVDTQLDLMLNVFVAYSLKSNTAVVNLHRKA